MGWNATDMTDQIPTGLLGLPPELRLQIYDLVYEPCFLPQQQFNPFYCTKDLKYCPKRGRISVLHQVNQQLRSECLQIYLERTTFVFDLSVLNADTGEPTLLSWAKSCPENLQTGRNIIINMRVVPRSRPMFTVFISNTTSGQRIRFKENDFRPECNLFGQGMRDAKLLLDQNAICHHKRCYRYVSTLNELKVKLRRLSFEIPSLRQCLDVGDVKTIACAGKLLELLHIPARWTRVGAELTAAQESLMLRYEEMIRIEREENRGQFRR